MSSKIFYKIMILLLLVLFAAVIFWGTFFITLDIINAIPIYGLGTCVPAVFSAFITGLVLVLLWINFLKESQYFSNCDNDSNAL